MKILLAAINAKYIHSNPAIHSLKAAAEQAGLPEDVTVELGEYTINHRIDDVRADLYRRCPDVLAFSCYIWNIAWVKALVRDLAQILPETEIWLGGPEVSWCGGDVLGELPEVRGILVGAGEATFTRLAQQHFRGEMPRGVWIREQDGTVRFTGEGDIVELNDLPFWYGDLTEFENRIIYYESSRGCPFSCSYCLSSLDRTLRFRDPEKVVRELQFFLDRQVPQVKFIDRTFNCRESHALHIWRYLAEHDNGVTNFHFEIAADLLTEAQLQVLSTMRPGLVQLEIGVQSTNPETVREIRRVMDLKKVADHVARIKAMHNIHQHLDLIAGLPGEDYESFGRSFDDVYAMEPDQLQLGFLKVLKGARMEQMADSYGLVYSRESPYEVMATRWLSYSDVLRLKGIEEMVEMFWNSGQFDGTLRLLAERFGRPFLLYESLAGFWEARGLSTLQTSRVRKYELLLEFACQADPEREAEYREALIVDCYLRENMKNRPGFGPALTPEDWQYWKDLMQEEAREHRHFPEYGDCGYRELMNRLHGEFLRAGGEPRLAVFSYLRRDPLNHNAAVTYLPLAQE